MKPDSRTITLDIAVQAIKTYNCGTYQGLKNTDVDYSARELFAGGLGRNYGEILKQVRFIGKDYGGVAGFRKALILAEAIAEDILDRRELFERAAVSARPILDGLAPHEIIAELYAPLVKPLHGKQNWQVWATKFWHFLNHDAFPIEDSRVDRFFNLETRAHSVEKYEELLRRFQTFALERRDWLPQLREADGGCACCDNKLWDKVFYGIEERSKRANLLLTISSLQD